MTTPEYESMLCAIEALPLRDPSVAAEVRHCRSIVDSASTFAAVHGDQQRIAHARDALVRLDAVEKRHAAEGSR